MAQCERCRLLQQELTEVKRALRTLDESEARGAEYSGEHEKLEQRRSALLGQIAEHEAGHAQP